MLSGERPERPNGEDGYEMNDGMWNVVERCWVRSPEERPAASRLLKLMENTLDEMTAGNGMDKVGRYSAVTRPCVLAVSSCR